MIPTTESMKTTGIPARVSATKITPSGISSWTPASSRTGDERPDRRPDRDGPGQGEDGHADAPDATRGEPGRAGQHRRQVVQGDEVVPHRHRDDRVEPGHVQRGRGAGAGELARRVLGRAHAGVDQQDGQADPGEGPHRPLPPVRPRVGDEGDHGHRAPLDRQRDPEPDRPQEGEAGELVRPEQGVAEHVAGEHVARDREDRQRHGGGGAHAGDADGCLRVDLDPAGQE